MQISTSLPFRFHEKTEGKLIQQSMNSKNRSVLFQHTVATKLYFCHISYTKVQFVGNKFHSLFLPHMQREGNNVITTSYNIVSISHKSAYRVLTYTTWSSNNPKCILYYNGLDENGLISKTT